MELQEAAERQTSPTLPGTRFFRASVVAVFFVCFFFYAWLHVEPVIEYYTDGVVFTLGRRFLNGFLSYPGGLTDYAAAFLAQLNYYNWLGALVLTGLCGAIFGAAGGIFYRATKRDPMMLCLAPCLVLLGWRGRYDGLSVSAGLLVLAALGGALAWKLVGRSPVWLRGPVWCLAGLGVYYVAGLWSLGLFLALGVCVEFVPKGRNKWLNAVGLVVTAALIPTVWHLLHLREPPLNPWGTGASLFFAVLLFLVLPVGFVLLSLLRPPPNASDDLVPVPPKKTTAPDKAKTAHEKKTPANPRFVWGKPALIIGMLLAGWVLVYAATDQARKDLDTIEYCGVTRQDERLLRVAARLKELPPDTEIWVHLALYHKGRLTQDLFSFPNRGHDDLVPGLRMGMPARRPEGETLLELGQVNDAEHQAQEGLENEGNRPDILRMLAEVNILKDRPRAAAVFLHILAEVPFQRDWAKAWLAELETNPRLTGHADLDLARSRMPRTDLPHTVVPIEDAMLQLLDSNPRNQMAFEYLMAYYLLKGDFRKLASHLNGLEQFGYTAVPRGIEEALLLGQGLFRLQFDLHGRQIQPYTIQRFQEFSDALKAAGGAAGTPPPSAVTPLKARFGDTFWYYYYSHER